MALMTWWRWLPVLLLVPSLALAAKPAPEPEGDDEIAFEAVAEEADDAGEPVEVVVEAPPTLPEAPEVSAGECHGGASMATAERAAGIGQPAAECLAAPVQEALGVAIAASEGRPELQEEFRERQRDVARLAHWRYKVRVMTSIALSMASLGLSQLFGL